MNQTPANNLYPIANGTTSSSPFVEVFDPRDPTPYDTNYPVQKRWLNTLTNVEWLLKTFYIANTGQGPTLQAKWVNLSQVPLPPLLQFDGGTGTAGAFPVFPTPVTGIVTLTSNDSSVLITGSANALDFSVTAAGDGTITGNDSTALDQVMHNWNIIGVSPISTAGTILTGTLSINLGTVPVSKGGTGDVTFTPYAVITGGHNKYRASSTSIGSRNIRSSPH